MFRLATAKPQHTEMAGLLGLAVVLFAATQTAAQLKVNPRKQCGDTWCEEFQYCREIDQICSPCTIICDPKGHNLQEKACETNCQDFLHFQWFETRHGKQEPAPSQDSDLTARVQKLQALATVSLVISLIFACIFLVILGIWAKKKNFLSVIFRSNSKKIHDKARYVGEPTISTLRLPNEVRTANLPPIAADAVRPSGKPMPDYAPMSTFKAPAPKKPPSPDTPSSTNKSVPGVSRVPSEDSTYAYDNPALTPSPKSTNKGIA